MKAEEKGYILAEVVAALLILGILLSFIIPLFKEWKVEAWEQSAQLEAISILQERMERLSSQSPLAAIKGGETRKSRMNPQQMYHIKWQTQSKKGQLMQIDVEVQWESRTQTGKVLKVTTYRYPTSLNRSRDLLMWRSSSPWPSWW
jgi:type II secretory pathway pseudopilin PulG